MEQEILTGSIIGNECVLTAEELARACRAEVSWIAELIEVGILEPQGEEQSGWRFCAADLTCARRAARLQRAFEANTDAVALMLNLLGEIDRLRERLRRAGLDADE
ncbi:MAG TPA: chaperone modulator CbpM [Nitrospira sp.]